MRLCTPFSLLHASISAALLSSKLILPGLWVAISRPLSSPCLSPPLPPLFPPSAPLFLPSLAWPLPVCFLGGTLISACLSLFLPAFPCLSSLSPSPSPLPFPSPSSSPPLPPALPPPPSGAVPPPLVLHRSCGPPVGSLTVSLLSVFCPSLYLSLSLSTHGSL